MKRFLLVGATGAGLLTMLGVVLWAAMRQKPADPPEQDVAARPAPLGAAPAPEVVARPAGRGDQADRPFTVEVIRSQNSGSSVPTRPAEPVSTEPIRTLAVGGRITALGFHPKKDGGLAVSTTEGEASVWSIASGTRQRSLAKRAGQVTAISFSPDASLILTACGDRNQVDPNTLEGEVIHDGAPDRRPRVAPKEEMPRRDPTPSAPAYFARLGDGVGDFSAQLTSEATGQPLRSLLGHEAGILAAGFDPTGRRVATAAADNRVVLWNAQSGGRIRTLNGHQGAVVALAFSPDGRSLLSGSLDRRAILWDLAEGQPLLEFPEHGSRVASVAISPDGLLAATGSFDQPTAGTPNGRKLSKFGQPYGTISLWDLTTGARIRGFLGHGHLVSALAFSPDGKLLLSGSWDHTARVWEVNTGRELARYSGDDSPIDAVAVEPGGGRLAFGTRHGKAFVHALSDRPAPGADRGTDPIHAMSISPDGKTLVTCSDRYFSANVWSLAEGRRVHTLRGHTALVSCAAFSPDGQQMVTASVDHSAALWDVKTGRELKRFERVIRPASGGKTIDYTFSGGQFRPRVVPAGPTAVGPEAAITSVAFAPDGKAVYSGSLFRTEAFVWPVAEGGPRPLPVKPTGNNSLADTLIAVAPCCEGKSLVSVFAEGLVQVHALPWTPGRQPEVIGAPGHERVWLSAEIAPSGDVMAVGAVSGAVRLWDLSRRKELPELKGHASAVQSVAFSPDGGRLISCSEDKTACVWDLKSGKKLVTLRGHSDAVAAGVLHPSGRLAITAGTDGTIRLWELPTGREIAKLSADEQSEDWNVVAANGRFDGSAVGRRRLFGGPTGQTALARFRDLYQPGLLAELVETGLPSAAPPALPTTAPEVRLALSADAPTDRQIGLEVVLTDRGAGWGAPRLFHNSVAVATPIQGRKEGGVWKGRVDVAPTAGANLFEVRAATADGRIESEPASLLIKVDGPVARPRLHAVVVGVSDYGKGMPALRFSVNDARAIAELLRSRAAPAYDVGEVRELLDGRASRAGVLAEINRVAKEMRPQDVFVFFAAGHGKSQGQRYYFLPGDFVSRGDTEADLRRDGLAVDDLAEAVARVPALKRVLILDTCQSGSVVDLGKGRSNLFALRGEAEKTAGALGLYILAAAAADKESLGLQKLEHGAMTYTLLAGLDPRPDRYLKTRKVEARGRDHTIDVESWLRFAQQQTPGLCRLFPDPGKLVAPDQSVEMVGSGSNFPLLTAGEIDPDRVKALREEVARRDREGRERFEQRLAELEAEQRADAQKRLEQQQAAQKLRTVQSGERSTNFAKQYPELAGRYGRGPSGGLLKEFTAPAGAGFEAVAFRSDGLCLACTADGKRTVSLWEVDRGTRLASWNDMIDYAPLGQASGFDPRPVRTLRDSPVAGFSADGSSVLLVMDRAGPSLVNTTTLKKRVALPGVKPAALGVSLTASPDHRRAVVPFMDRQVVWDLETSRQLDGFPAPAGYYGRHTPVAFSGDELAVQYTTLSLFDLKTKKETASFAVGGELRLLDPTRVLTASDGNLTVWSRTGRVEQQFRHRAGEVTASAFSPDGQYLAAAGRKYLSVWTVGSGKLLAHWKVGGDDFVAFSPDGARIVTGSTARVELWRFDPQAATQPNAEVKKDAAVEPKRPMPKGFLEMGQDPFNFGGGGPFVPPGPGGRNPVEPDPFFPFGGPNRKSDPAPPPKKK